MRIGTGKTFTDIRALWWENDHIQFIDQRKLPYELCYFPATTVKETAYAIKEMIVRGAPSIGAAGAYGMALAIVTNEDPIKAKEVLASTRPTAHDLFHALNCMIQIIQRGDDVIQAAQMYADTIVNKCRKIGEYGSSFIENRNRVLTHCNAGALATVDIGTALAPIRKAHDIGKDIFVYVDETRPRLQGRLTAWELTQEGIAHRIIPDNAAGYFMNKGMVDIVITGADRIAMNGDTANKIGTYEKAVLAKENGIPFYIAAPVSTFDPSIADGSAIPIENRDEIEVLEFQGNALFGKGEKADNPAFDVTPARYISGFVTEMGVIEADDIMDYVKKESM